MKSLKPAFTLTAALLLWSNAAQSQSLPTQALLPLQRLPASELGVTPPSARVTGTPGTMRITDRSCRSMPLTDVRRRIVNAAAQEWAYFGFNTEVQSAVEAAPSSTLQNRARRPGMSSTEATRLADSIAGYWAAAPQSDWILEKQNQNWTENGSGVRWRDAWSAHFLQPGTAK